MGGGGWGVVFFLTSQSRAARMSAAVADDGTTSSSRERMVCSSRTIASEKIQVKGHEMIKKIVKQCAYSSRTSDRGDRLATALASARQAAFNNTKKVGILESSGNAFFVVELLIDWISGNKSSVEAENDEWRPRLPAFSDWCVPARTRISTL